MNAFFQRSLTAFVPVFIFLAILIHSFIVVSADTWGADGQTQSGGDGDGTSGGDGEGDSTQTIYVVNPLKSDTIEAFIFAIIDIILVFALPIVIFFIMYAGFLYTTARGNVSQIEQAHAALLWALIGGVVVLGAKVIVEVVQGTVEGLQL